MHLTIDTDIKGLRKLLRNLSSLFISYAILWHAYFREFIEQRDKSIQVPWVDSLAIGCGESLVRYLSSQQDAHHVDCYGVERGIVIGIRRM